MRNNSKILLIEDDSNYAHMLKVMLVQSKSSQFDLYWSECLSKGLDQLTIEDFDLVLLDLNLPDSGGFDTFFRTSVQAPDVPIIVLTGMNDESLAVRAVQMGAQDYLIKGQTNTSHLTHSITYAIERHKAQVKQREQDHYLNQTYFRNIIERNADGIIIVDKDRVIRYANPATELLFGRKAEDLIGQSFDVPFDAGQSAQVDIVNKEGNSVPLEMRVAKIRWEGNTAYLASLRDITEQKKTEEALRHLSITDDLTGLYNRRGFLTFASYNIKLATLTRRELLLVLADLDDLKQINDKFGHHEGDLALIETGNILKSTFRKSDVIARIGGDEFVILVTDVPYSSAEAVIDRLNRNIEAHNGAKNRRYKLSISIGIAHHDLSRPGSIDELISRADKLMYAYKQRRGG